MYRLVFLAFFDMLRTSYIFFISSVFFRVLSVVSLLLALVLPWKILSLTVNDESNYFYNLSFFDNEDLKVKVSIWVAVIVALFIFHLIAESFSFLLVKKGAEKAVNKNKKTGVFKNYREFARQSYENYVLFFSSLVYIFFVFIWLNFFYPSLLVSLLVYSLVFMFFSLLFFYSLNIKKESILKLLSKIYKIWWSLGFIFALIWVVTDYWKNSVPVLIVAFASLLLYRHMLIMMTVAFDKGRLVFKYRVRAVQVFSNESNSKHQVKSEIDIGFESMLVDINNQKWLRDIIKKHLFDSHVGFDIVCNLVEGGNVSYITIESNCYENVDGLLVKLFNKRYGDLAEQEISLLENSDVSWPFMQLLEHKNVKGYLMLVSKWHALSKWMDAEARLIALPKLRENLLSIQLSEKTANLYMSSHADLFGRINNISWEYLQFYSGAESKEIDWDVLQKDLLRILSCVNRLPRQLLLYPLSSRMMFFSHKYGLRLANVNRWSWEPLGSGWPLGGFKLLPNTLFEAAILRPELKDVDPEKVKLVARLYEFERRYQNKNYAGAVNVLSNLLNHFEEMQAKKTQDSEKIES